MTYAREMVAKHPKYKDSPNWRDKVYRMPPNQILAIYHRMLERGEFVAKKKPEPVEKPNYIQPTLFDYGLKVEDHDQDN